MRSVIADVYVFYTGTKSSTILEEIFPFCSLCRQEGVDIWDRMKNSIDKLFSKGYEKIILIGTDIPQMSTSHVNRCFRNLEEYNLVITPTYDEGYCLIGMDSTYLDVFDVDELCTQKKLSVLESTKTIAIDRGLRIHETKPLLDLDEYNDLLTLLEDRECKCSNTLNYIKKIVDKYSLLFI